MQADYNEWDGTQPMLLPLNKHFINQPKDSKLKKHVLTFKMSQWTSNDAIIYLFDR